MTFWRVAVYFDACSVIERPRQVDAHFDFMLSVIVVDRFTSHMHSALIKAIGHYLRIFRPKAQ